MNAATLLQHFDRISEAPEAVARLRRFILDLAVRGKLVAQDRSDEPAAELLKRIQAEKARLVKVGLAKKEKAPVEVKSAQAPFKIPNTWRWSQLAEVGFISPRNAAPVEALSSFVPMPMISTGYGVSNQHEPRPWGDIKTGYTHFAEGDVGLAKITPCFENGKSTVFRELTGGIGAGTTELHIVRPVIVNADYILIFLKCPHFIDSGIPKMTGTAGQKRVPAEYFSRSPFPLPPLAEQHRIVAKVDELMALCDQLQAARDEREARRDRLVAASLHRIGAAAVSSPLPPEVSEEKPRLREGLGVRAEQARNHSLTPALSQGERGGKQEGPSRMEEAEQQAWPQAARFHLDHLPRLTTRPEHIKLLRQTILNLAVRGRLVPQDPNDEPAAELLKRIQAEKARLSKEGLIPRSKASAGSSRLVLELPSNWQPIRFEDVCNLVTSGSRGWAEYYADTGAKFVRAQNIRFGCLRLDDLACVQPPANSEGKRTQVSVGDLLIVITGAGVTNPALLDRDLGEAYVSQHVALIKPTRTALSRWLLLCLMSGPGGREELVKCAYGAGKPGLNLDNIRSLAAPFPPLAEQHRIVAKVDELMARCDQLEQQLVTTDTGNRRLLEAVLRDALAPALENAA